MLYGLSNGIKIEASPNAQSVCQCCNSELIPKCGKTNIWHWAHKSKAHCDDWYEPETKWHKDWKNKFPKKCQEIVFKDNATGEKHIADVYLPNGLVFEFQNSNISSEEIQQRENFYKKMIWVINGDKFHKNIFDSGGNHFEWVHIRKIWSFAKMPIFIDFPNTGAVKGWTKEFKKGAKREYDFWDYSNTILWAKEFTGYKFRCNHQKYHDLQLRYCRYCHITAYNFIGQKVDKAKFIEKYVSYS